MAYKDDNKVWGTGDMDHTTDFPEGQGDDLGNSNNLAGAKRAPVGHANELASRSQMLRNVGGTGKADAGTKSHLAGTTHSAL